MRSKSSGRRQKQGSVGHRHRAQSQSATDALMATSPTRRSPAIQHHQVIGVGPGPSAPYRSEPMPSPGGRRVLFSPPATRRRLISPPPPHRLASPPVFTNPFYAPSDNLNLPPMDLDGYLAGSAMSVATDRMSVTPDSDGASTAGPMDFQYNHPHVPSRHPRLPSPPSTYFVNAVDLDNLRSAIHFMHHAVVLVDGTLGKLRAQNPHCPYLYRGA
ncbi:hypothetical protein MD484_g8536, partial [Candolleomyces efflorescens]